MNKLYANISIQPVQPEEIDGVVRINTTRNIFYVCSENPKINCYRSAFDITALKATLQKEYPKYTITFLTSK